ncbi:MAG: 50S ribosomal protein L9 [Verrucomicrobia bacterium]|nr:50S ribosomal protein L9 [Verrucomicrobiota bacterium]
MKNQLLLLEDVDGLGRSGDIVTVRPGFARNFLIPKQKAVVAKKHLVRLQERLREERAKKAVVDKADALEMAKKLEGQKLTATMKFDAEGHMYGSVTAHDVVSLFKDQLGIELDKRNILIHKGIKEKGTHEIELRLKEGVPAKIILQIVAEVKEGQ